MTAQGFAPQTFTPQTWSAIETFTGRCAAPADVDAGRAVFALTDTMNAQVFEEPLPQPVIWYDEDDTLCALIVQAEAHETETGERLEVLGLKLPNGETRIAFTEDVEEVSGGDPVWLELFELSATGLNSTELASTELASTGLAWGAEDEAGGRIG